jgi:hypothetical protein
MTIRIKMLIGLGLSLVCLFIGYMILQAKLNASDVGDIFVKTGKSLFYGMSALSLIFLLLVFVPSAFSAWKKFAIWFIPLATLIFIFYPNPGSGDYFSPYPEQVFQWVSILYVSISFLIIAFRRNN